MTNSTENVYEVKERKIAISEISNSTACATLGKRDHTTHSFFAPGASKRQKNFDSAS